MNPKRRPLIALPILLIAALAAIVIARRGGPDKALVASGTVEATEAQLGLPVAGRLDTVRVDEGDPVRAGEEIAFLDRAETVARREQSVAQAAVARAQLEELERGSRSEEVAEARAAAAAARQRLEDAARDLTRIRALRENGAVSQESLDKAITARDVAQSLLDQAEEQRRLVESGPRRERIAAARAQLAQAEAAVRVLDATLRNLSLRSSFDGVVTVRHREPGEIVPAGSPVLTVMDPSDRWVRIYVPETRIGAVKLGQRASITTDTFRRRAYEGTVEFIASEAEFTPKTVQTREERVKLVYAVKVRITGDPGLDLKPGMPADVRLDGVPK
jgi:HlyD family secretion protein